MRVLVIGLQHLGMCTAAGLASVGHHVIGIGERWSGAAGEPGLVDLTNEQMTAARLRFNAPPSDCDVIWYTEDTPVDANDRGDVDGLVCRVVGAIRRYADRGQLVIVSSQVPIGTMDRIALESSHRRLAYIPENLKKGKGLERFLRPDRFVAGVTDERDRATVAALLAPITQRIEWMPIRAAEATKHAINSYLAACITLTNELADLWRAHGVDPKDVERGLRTDARVGDGPPVTPGGPIRGGTLLRDVWYLQDLMTRHGLYAPVIQHIHQSNDARLLAEEIGKAS